jgi:hypothetical protein
MDVVVSIYSKTVVTLSVLTRAYENKVTYYTVIDIISYFYNLSTTFLCCKINSNTKHYFTGAETENN